MPPESGARDLIPHMLALILAKDRQFRKAIRERRALIYNLAEELSAIHAKRICKLAKLQNVQLPLAAFILPTNELPIALGVGRARVDHTPI